MVEEALLPQHLEICVITKQKSREKELQQEQRKLEVLFAFSGAFTNSLYSKTAAAASVSILKHTNR